MSLGYMVKGNVPSEMYGRASVCTQFSILILFIDETI